MKLLLSSVCRPIGPSQGDGKSVGYELLFGQVTRAQGVFSPRATHRQYSLEYIAANVDTPTTVLHYPSRRQFIGELKKGYDYVGIAFIAATHHHMKRMVALVRKYSPKTKIVLGGYGTAIDDRDLTPYADHICRGEGVAFMRDLLGEPPRPMPYEHPTVLSKLKVFSIPVSKTGLVFGGLGCPNGCDFCCTSHFFKRKHIRLLPTGKDIYRVLCRYQDLDERTQFTVLDEDFLLNKKRAMDFLEHVRKGKRTFSIFAFASIKALSQYTMEELVELGIDGVWIGYEGTRSGYHKQKGRSPKDLFPDLRRHGILVLGSMIVGFDYQNREVIRDEFRGLMRLRPALAQFLIYGPAPGTPFFDRVMKEGKMRRRVAENRTLYYRECTGFTSAVEHPTMSEEDIQAAQQECFEQDFQRLGPSIWRAIRVMLSGYEHLRRSPHVALRRKGLLLGADVRRAYPLFWASRLFAPNRRIRRWLAALEKRAYRELGPPDLLEQFLRLAAIPAALWTRFTLCFDFFQHPGLTRTRHRWEPAYAELTRWWGEMSETGMAAELRAWWERKSAEGWASINLEGSLDGKTAEQFAASMREWLDHHRERLEISLKDVKWVDRKALVEFARTFRKFRSRVRVTLPESPIRDMPDLKAIAAYFTGPKGSTTPA